MHLVFIPKLLHEEQNKNLIVQPAHNSIGKDLCGI